MECDAFHVLYLSDKLPEAIFHGQSVKTVAYLRVSTAQQDVPSQRLANTVKLTDFLQLPLIDMPARSLSFVLAGLDFASKKVNSGQLDSANHRERRVAVQGSTAYCT